MRRALRPTELELEILKVLWKQGPSTVRGVQETLSPQRQAGYTTVLKMLQVMTEKRLVLCDSAQRAHIYRARENQHLVLGRLTKDLLERAFNGSVQQLMLHALEPTRTTRAELAEIRDLLEDLERREKDG